MPKHDFLSPRRTGRADLPHPALAETLASSMHRLATLRSQRDQTQMFHLSVNRRTFGRPVGTLAAAPQMFPQAPLHVAVDLAESAARITIAKVAGPAFQVAIQLPDQLRNRDAILWRAGHLAQLRPLPRQGLRRRNHIQVTMPSPLRARPIVPKRESQKVQTGSLLLQLHYPRLLPVDLQPHPGFQLCLDPFHQSRRLLLRQHHEVSSAGDSPPDALSEPY